jgi:glycosyltransferase involved in cell wall biosynthesis
VRRLAQSGAIELAHHVTFGAYWYPSAACTKDIPFVVGPVGGAEATPKPLRMFLSPVGRFTEGIRSLTRRLAEYDPFVRATLRNADLVYATTDETMAAVRHIGAKRVELMAHVGWRDESGVHPTRRVSEPDQLTVLSVSRLIDWKGIEIGLRAFAAMAESRVRYVVLGTGPSRARLERLARDLGVGDRVVFVDRLSDHDAVLQLMADSDVFLHPAMHESGGMSVAEAMGVGLPCVVLNAGGPGILVDESCGIVVEPDKRVIAGIAAALDRLCADRVLRATLGERAGHRVRASFGWPARAVQVRHEYEQVLAANRQQRSGM